VLTECARLRPGGGAARGGPHRPAADDGAGPDRSELRASWAAGRPGRGPAY